MLNNKQYFPSANEEEEEKKKEGLKMLRCAQKFYYFIYIRFVFCM